MSEDPPSPNITVEKAWRDCGVDLVACADAAISATLTRAGLDRDAVEVGVTFTDDATIRTLNAHWRSHDKPTDVLAFPVTEPTDALPNCPTLLLGDIVLAWETCALDARELGRPLAHHVTHLLVHGLLHLLHHDHDTPAAADAMEQLEVLILGQLGVADPYANRRLCEETL